jgi:hypothetical protein
MSSASRKFRSSRGREKFASVLAVTDQNWVGKVMAKLEDRETYRGRYLQTKAILVEQKLLRRD